MCPILHKIVCIDLIYNGYVLVLIVGIDLIFNGYVEVELTDMY